MVCSVMKRVVFLLTLLLGFGAQPALGCTAGEADAHPFRAVASGSVSTAVELDRLGGEQRCECPARTEVTQATVAESAKFALIASFESSAALPDVSLTALRRALDVHGRLLSGASPAGVLPLYLLTARLRC